MLGISDNSSTSRGNSPDRLSSEFLLEMTLHGLFSHDGPEQGIEDCWALILVCCELCKWPVVFSVFSLPFNKGNLNNHTTIRTMHLKFKLWQKTSCWQERQGPWYYQCMHL